MINLVASSVHEKIRARSFSACGDVFPFSDWCGIRYMRSTPQDTQILLPFADRISDNEGRIGSGVVSALVDCAAGQVATASRDWQAQVATISMQQSFVALAEPGADLLAEGQLASDDGRTIMVDVRVSTTALEKKTHIADARVRLVAVQDACRKDRGLAVPPPICPSDDPLFGPDDMLITRSAGQIIAELSSHRHYLGNTGLGALHGGVIAAALVEATLRLGDDAAPPFRIADGQVDFLSPAMDAGMVVKAEILRAGRRVAFCSAALEQDVPGKGMRPVARFNATMGR